MHAVAGVAAIVMAPILIVFSPAGTRLVAGLYAGAVVGLFVISATYHRVHWSPGIRGFWKRLDHSMIFIAIAATYTPIAVFVLPDTSGRWILLAVWAGAAFGIGTQLVWPHAPKSVTVVPYLLCGWAVAPVIHQVWISIGVAGFVLLLIGGLLFSVGAGVYALRRPDPSPTWFGYHEVFHVLVTVAVAVHYVTIAFYALPKGGTPAG